MQISHLLKISEPLISYTFKLARMSKGLDGSVLPVTRAASANRKRRKSYCALRARRVAAVFGRQAKA